MAQQHKKEPENWITLFKHYIIELFMITNGKWTGSYIRFSSLADHLKCFTQFASFTPTLFSSASI